jgi:phage shock protein C
MVYCSKCGKKNPDDVAYCDKCGAKLEKTESQLEKNIDHFGEEMEQIGKKIKKTAEDLASPPKDDDKSPRKLYRSGKDKIISGVCGGLGEYFDIDPLLVRVLFIILLFPTVGTWTLVYLLLWILVPRNPNHKW